MVMGIHDKWLTKRTTISIFRMRTSKNTRNYTNRPKHTSHLHWRFWIRRSSRNWIVWLRTHTEKHIATYPICNRSLIFSEEKSPISQDHDMLDGSDWECRTANTLHVTDDHFERFHAKQKLDRHLNEYEGKFTVDQVGTYSVSSQHEQNHEDNQRKMLKINEELTELLQTETTHIMKINEELTDTNKTDFENLFTQR